MKLELEEKEINFILEVLSQRPYKEVALLINKVHQQANKQKESSDE